MNSTFPPPPLVASYWTLAGAYPGRGPGYSRFSLLDRAQAAQQAGFCGLGLLDADLERIVETHSLRDCKVILDDHGITQVELEFLVDWFQDGELRRVSDERRRFLFEASDVLEPRLIKVGDFQRSRCPLPRLIDSFRQLCAEARDHGTAIAFEPMGAAVIGNLSDALALVRGAESPNGGLAIDIWHMVDRKIPFSEVARLPHDVLFCVELGDAKMNAGGSPSENREFCGEGSCDVPSFIEAVQAAGFKGPWGVELFSDELVSMDLGRAATKAAETTRARFS